MTNVLFATNKDISQKIAVTETDHVMRDMKEEIMVDAEDILVQKVVVQEEKEVTTGIAIENIEEEMTEKEITEDHHVDLQEENTEVIEETDTDWKSCDYNSIL